LVVDVTVTPMEVVATLDNNQIHPAGCGGIQVGGTMYINSGGGWPVAPLSYDVYALDISNLPKSISAKLVSQRDDRFADSHGMASIGRYVWNADRAGNNLEIIDTLSNLSVGSINLETTTNADPAPDLLDVSPDGQYVFVTLRGQTPLTGNDKDAHNAKGTVAGVGVIHVDEGGRVGHYKGQAAITNMKEGKETADAHGIAARK
jgi:DNA-binding beta-propeller fold protein YncE